MTIQNKSTIEAREPTVRRRRFDETRRPAADPVLVRECLLRTSMIASVRRAETLA